MQNPKDDTLRNFKNTAQQFKNDASEAIDETGEDIRDTANRAGRKVRGYINSASEEFSTASDRVTSEIRSNPVQSAAIALGVGLMLGALLRRL